MEKEDVPKLKIRKGCSHDRVLPMYGREGGGWISTKQINGRMTYICVGCGAFLDKEFIKSKEEVGG